MLALMSTTRLSSTLTYKPLGKLLVPAGAGVMGLMSVWVGGLEKPCTGQFGASAMSAMSTSMSTPSTTEHALKNGT